ncbi:MAG: hypothetical protein KAR42_12575 [candidate division Zixibacteria bacterium]|nr:hypothetical protein [candidate division Zixibacteria bacterium]
MKKIASVDIGTNSVLYSLFDVTGKNRLTETHFERHSPRIGSNMTGSKKPRITETNYQTLLKIIRRIVKHADKNQAEAVLIGATNPFRIAQNGTQIKKSLEWEIGVPVNILTPKQEAEMSFLGAIGPLADNKTSMIIDLGGGSTEFVAYRGKQRTVFKSIPEGAVSLTEKFDTRLEADKKRFSEYEASLKGYNRSLAGIKRHVDGKIVLVGGTSSALAWLLDNSFHLKAKGTDISLKELTFLVNMISGLNLTCRRQLLSIDKKRAEIIFAGAFWLLYLFNRLDIKKVQASPRGLRHGMALEFLEGM